MVNRNSFFRLGRAQALALLAICAAGVVLAKTPGEKPALGQRSVTQESITAGKHSLQELRNEGLRIFTVPFNRLDGYGDGLLDPTDTVTPGGRPTLQGNGTFLRINGLDAQACLECHTQVSAATMPPRLGIGGAGGSNSNAMIMTTAVDPADLEDFDGNAAFNGRFANPPFMFGAGAVELLAMEMTQDLLEARRKAEAHPGVVVPLFSKGVDFGAIRAEGNGAFDTTQIQGVADDLIVRPFGRKGEFATIREFDIGATQFHFGMQPTEVVGEGTDPDLDGVVDELLPGELSLLSIFIATLERPQIDPMGPKARRGFRKFKQIGCANCHVPFLETEQRWLPLRFPEIADDPLANVFYRIDLSRGVTRFPRNKRGGIRVPLFADLKRHDMGPELAESFHGADEATNREFTTARLWGIADSAPYLHDGRATTLSDAILLHGGEAQAVRDRFAALDSRSKRELLTFLRKLRTPEDPARGLGEEQKLSTHALEVDGETALTEISLRP